MPIDVHGPQAKPRQQFESHDFGNARVMLGQMELDALAEDEVAAVAKVPPHARLYALGQVHDALGANTGITFGYETLDGASSGVLNAIADTSTAGVANTVFEPIDTGDSGIYITATQTGVGTATGTVAVQPHYVHDGD